MCAAVGCGVVAELAGVRRQQRPCGAAPRARAGLVCVGVEAGACPGGVSGVAAAAERVGDVVVQMGLVVTMRVAEGAGEVGEGAGARRRVGHVRCSRGRRS